MNIISKATRISLAVGILFILSFAIQLTPTQAAGTCNLTTGQVVINEIFPKATGGVDWVELHNTTSSSLDLSYCYIDDIAAGGGSPIQIAAGNSIPAHGFWTLDRSSYFNNGGDDVRLLLDDASTVLDTYTYTDTVSYDYSWYRSPDGGAWASTPTASPTKGTTNSGSSGICGTGTWVSGNLEIHHIDIGQGDSALIVSPTGRSLLFDAGESNWNSSAKAQIIGPYIQAVLGCKSLDYVVISHFHLDHIGYVGYGGLWNLVETQGFSVGTTLLRNYNNYLGETTGTFDNWKAYLQGAGQAKLNPITAVEGTGQVDLGPGVTFDIITLNGNGAIIAGDFSADASPPSENDYSIGVLLSYGNFDEWIGGDLDGEYEVGGFGYTYHDIELSAAPEVGDVDVYKVNHHASSHSTSPTFIGQIDPEVSIVSVGDGNTYGHPTQVVMDRLLATSTVYMTERGETTTNIGSAIVAGNIVIKTSNGSSYTVNGTPYTATEPVRTDNDGDGYFVEVDPADNNSGVIPAPNGGCGTIYQTCSTTCQVSTGQVLINEILPAPSSGPEWVELFNTTASTLNIGYCYIDDSIGGSAAYQIPAGTTISGRGFWTLDRTSYFNNTGDDVRFLKENASTVLDSYSYGNTGSNLSWYRLPNGGPWEGSPTASPTKGRSNNISGPDTTGVFRPSNGLLYLKNANTTGFADIAINYGLGGDYPVTGDWDGNGTATIGIYRNGSFYLRNSNTLGFADLVFAFGTPGDQPIAGDWNGDGVDTIGVYRPSTGQFLLRNNNSAGVPDMSFYLGNVGDVGIAGDWNGDGIDTTGVFRPSNGVIFLKNTNATGFADIALNYGLPGDQPVTGDWDGDGIDTIGIYRNGVFYLRNSNTIGFADLVFGLGNPGDMPISGDWDGIP